jgi:hypothetical protein
MQYDHNPKDVVDDPEPIVDRDPNDGLIDPTPEWIEWHLSQPLTQDFVDGLRRRLEAYGDEVGLEELNSLTAPSRFDFQRLLHHAEAKYNTRSNLKVLTW